MKLQARNIVAELDASDDEKKQVLTQIIEQKDYSESYAQLVLKQIRGGK